MFGLSPLEILVLAVILVGVANVVGFIFRKRPPRAD